jgi:hypothetical protein
MSERIVSHVANKNYRDNWESTFGEKAKEMPEAPALPNTWRCECGRRNYFDICVVCTRAKPYALGF